MKKSLLRYFFCILSATFIFGKIAICQTVILSEDFAGFSNNTHASPGSTDVSASLDTKTTVPGWTGSKIYEAGGEIKLGTSSVVGWIETPAVDLSANGGNFVVKFDIARWPNDATTVQVYVDGTTAIGEVITPADAFQTIQINGSGGTSTSKIKIAALTKRFYLDNFSIFLDNASPVATFDPLDAAVDVPVTIHPTITFDEAVRKTDGNPLENADLDDLIIFKETDGSGTDVAFTAEIDAGKKVITVTPSATLGNSKDYYLAIGSVEDASGNVSTPSDITFTTIGLLTPTVTVIHPNGGEKFYSGDKATITWTTNNFEAGENVKIEVKIPDDPDWIWIPLVESTDNDGSEEVNVGPDADYGTQYLIRISGVTNMASDESDNPFTVIATAATLLDLRSYPVGAVVKYKGVATVTYARSTSTYSQKFIQDATAAILIHDGTTPPGYITGTYNIGDGITNVEGKMTLYNGLLELVPQATTGEPATGITIVPEVVTITDLTSDDQSKLVKIEKVKFASPSGNFVAGSNYSFDGVATTHVMRTAFSEADYITTPTPVPTGYFNVVVLVGQYNTVIQVTPRNWADFTLLSSAKAITSFVFESLEPDVTGTIDENAKTVTLTVPNGTDVTTLVPTIIVSDLATVSPLSGVASNFSSPVVYSVTAEDGSTQDYTVTVSVISGIEETLLKNITIYPVPAKDILKVRNINNVRNIEILDATGKLIRSCNLRNDFEINIPVSDLKQGIYFLRLTTPEGKVLRKFVK